MKRNYLFALLIGGIALTGCRKEGCTDPVAINYNENANNDDGSCEYGAENSTYSGNQDTDITLSNDVEDSNQPDYYVEGVWSINANVTIEPGTVIEMGAGASIIVNAGGSFNAVGTAQDKIIIRGAQSTPGFWDDIRFDNSNNVLNVLSHVNIMDGGGNSSWNASVYCYDGGRLKVNNTSIQNSQRYGMIVYTAAFELDEFDNNTISNCGQGAIKIQANDMGAIEGNSTFTNNGDNYYEVDGGSIDLNQTWNKTNAPFFMNGNTNINADVTVQPGAQFLMGPGANIIVYSAGSLNAIGTASDNITFSGEQNTKGYWSNIRFDGSNNTNNEFQYVTVDYGGGNTSWNGAIYLYDGSSFQMGNSAVNNSQTWGVLNHNNTSTFVDDGNNTFSGNENGNIGN
jgi:hypothetical protein